MDRKIVDSLQSSVMAPAHPWRGYFCIATATLCWGAAATFGKAVFTGRLFAGHPAISPLVLSQTRTSFSVLLLAPFLPLYFGRRIFRISGRDLLLAVMAGTLGVAGSNFFYYLAIQKSTVAIAITLQYTAPVWVLLYMTLRGRQRASLQQVLAVAIALAGVTLAIGLFYSDVRLNRSGVGAALLASFSFALYNIVAQGLVTRNHQLKIMFYVLLSAALFWLVLDPPPRLAAQQFSAAQWMFLFAFACASMLLPYIFFFTGLKYLDPTRAVVTSCLEPVFAIVFAVIFVGEALRPLQVLGIAAVLAATVMIQQRSPATMSAAPSSLQ